MPISATGATFNEERELRSISKTLRAVAAALLDISEKAKKGDQLTVDLEGLRVIYFGLSIGHVLGHACDDCLELHDRIGDIVDKQDADERVPAPPEIALASTMAVMDTLMDTGKWGKAEVAKYQNYLRQHLERLSE